MNMRPVLHRWSGFAAAAVLLLAACTAPAAPTATPGLSTPERSTVAAPLVPTAAAPTVTIVLVRHGEKGTNDRNDPDLSDVGRARADALAALLADAGVTHLFASEFKRTSQTLAPLQAHTGLEIEITKAAAVKELAAKLAALPAGSIAVVAGHSDTLPEIAKALGGALAGAQPGGPIGDILPPAEYDRLTLLLLPAPGSTAVTTGAIDAGRRAGVTTLRLHYGAR